MKDREANEAINEWKERNSGPIGLSGDVADKYYWDLVREAEEEEADEPGYIVILVMGEEVRRIDAFDSPVPLGWEDSIGFEMQVQYCKPSWFPFYIKGHRWDWRTGKTFESKT